MHTNILVQQGNTLQVCCSVEDGIKDDETTFSINECVTFHLRYIRCDIRRQMGSCIILVRFLKTCHADDLTYSMTLSSNTLKIEGQRFLCDKEWQFITNSILRKMFDISVVIDTVQDVSLFKALYNDTELTDFELRGEDGSVKVHKAVLAASSDVLRRMISGSWRETTEGHVDVPGTSTLTLQHLKDYIYLRKLPDTGLEQILLLASYYMIPDLEQKCVNKLIKSLSAQNACDLLEFAVKHKVTRLVLGILDCVQCQGLEVMDMRQHFLNNQDNNCEK